MRIRGYASLALGAALLSSAWAPPCLAQKADAATTHAGQLALQADAQLGLVVPNATQRRTLFAASDRIVAILRRDDALAHPVGYATIVHRAAGVTGAGGESLAPSLPPHYGVVGALAYYAVGDDGKVGDGGGRVRISIIANGIGRIEDVEQITPALDGGPPVLGDYRVTGQFRGHPVYNGECVVISRRTAMPPFVPLTKERYLKLQIAKFRADSARHDAEHRADAGNTTSAALAAWIRERPKREADMRATYDAVTKMDPKAGAEFLDTWRKSQADAEARLRSAASSDADQRIKEIERNGTAGEGQRIAALQAQLDALSPAERKSPAAVLQLGVAGAALAPVDDPESLPLVQINSAFFDKTLAADVAQVVTVCLPGLQSGIEVTSTEWNDQRARDTALIRDHLDWSAIEALVKG